MTFYCVMLNLSAFVEPLFITIWVENKGLTWTMVAHAVITVACFLPVLIILHRFGASLRRKNGMPSWANSELT